MQQRVRVRVRVWVRIRVRVWVRVNSGWLVVEVVEAFSNRN